MYLFLLGLTITIEFGCYIFLKSELKHHLKPVIFINCLTHSTGSLLLMVSINIWFIEALVIGCEIFLLQRLTKSNNPIWSHIVLANGASILVMGIYSLL